MAWNPTVDEALALVVDGDEEGNWQIVANALAAEVLRLRKVLREIEGIAATRSAQVLAPEDAAARSAVHLNMIRGLATRALPPVEPLKPGAGPQFGGG